MKSLCTALLVLFVLCIVGTGFTSVALVPSQYSTIQGALTATDNLDTIMVTDGTYTGDGFRDLSFGGKTLTLMSENGSGFTTIDLSGSEGSPHRFLVFNNEESEQCNVVGFTIINGWTPESGGAIFCDYIVHPNFIDCVFRDNYAYRHGGAVATARGSGPDFVDCVFENNESRLSGGAMQLSDDLSSHCHLTDCLFTGNNAGLGGALRLYFARPVTAGCTFFDNHSSGSGGAISAMIGSTSYNRCVFDSNTAESDGGAISLGESFPWMDSCLFVNNSATGKGGAVNWVTPDILAKDGDITQPMMGPVFSQCTFYGNSAEDIGAAIHSDQFDTGGGYSVKREITLNGCLVVANGPVDPIYSSHDSTITILNCCDMWANQAGDWIGQSSDQAGTDGNFSTDPLFCGALAGNFGLAPGSPALPTGNSCVEQIGAYGLGCQGATALIEPNPLAVFETNAIPPLVLTITAGNFPDGYTAEQVATSSVVVNGNLIPTDVQIGPAHPDFDGSVLIVSLLAPGFIGPYGQVFDTTYSTFAVAGEYGDVVEFTAPGIVALIGHVSGDVNSDGVLDISDLVYLVDYQFGGGPAPKIPAVVDSDCSGMLDITDLIALVDYMYMGGPRKVACGQ